MPYDLDRFKEIHTGGFATAVAELRAGRKQSHWIWYVFPQLRGLGSSPPAVRYGLDGVGEACAFLGDPLLRERYHEALSTVHAQLVGHKARVERLMGSHIDALKLVSSVTLFEHAARTLEAAGDDRLRDELARLTTLASEVLAAAQAQGYQRCSFTMQQIRASSARNHTPGASD
jgi:uncharacterized protein (DUF1810 family)